MRSITRRIGIGLDDVVEAQGTLIKVLSLDVSSLIVTVNGEPATLKAGDKFRYPVEFTQIRLSNPATNGAVANIEFLVGEGDHESQTFNGAVALTSSAPAPAALDSQPDVTLATANHQDYALDAAAREYHIQAADANTGDLRIRDQGGTTDEGIRLKPGATYILATGAAFRIRNNTGANQTYSILKVSA